MVTKGQKSLVLLLVEDDPAVRAALLGPLESGGFEAIGTADAAEAFEVLARHRVDVVVTDYHLPGIAGLDLLAAIREAAPGASVILYSGGRTDELAAEAREFDVRQVLEKPVSAERLIEAVRAAMVAGYPGGGALAPVRPPCSAGREPEREAAASGVGRRARPSASRMPADAERDRPYGLPLSEFTRARNALARTLAQAARLAEQAGEADRTRILGSVRAALDALGPADRRLRSLGPAEPGAVTAWLHELMGALNAIAGWAELLGRKPRDTAIRRRALEVIERNATSLVRLLCAPPGDPENGGGTTPPVGPPVERPAPAPGRLVSLAARVTESGRVAPSASKDRGGEGGGEGGHDRLLDLGAAEAL